MGVGRSNSLSGYRYVAMVVSRSQTTFFSFECGWERSGKHSIALLFWQSDWRILIESIGSPAIHILYARGSMGSIVLHQSAGLCAQPEAAQDNPQNLSTARTTMPCYVYQTLFPHPHTQEKKAVWLRKTIAMGLQLINQFNFSLRRTPKKKKKSFLCTN